MFVAFIALGIYAVIADTARKEDARQAERQLDVALEKSLAEQKVRSDQSKGEHETLAKFLFGVARENKDAHKETHKQLSRIQQMIRQQEKEKAALKKAAQDNLETINSAPANSETYRRALHSARDWARDYRRVTGNDTHAPNAKDGGKAVADFYTARLGELTE